MRLFPAQKRAGVSLLEVLISVFVLLFGLLGVAAMFPVGNYFASRATLYDRAGSIGHAAFNDLHARGYFDPNRWVTASGASAPVLLHQDEHDWPVCVDPLGIAMDDNENGTRVAPDNQALFFPFGSGLTGSYPNVMRRLTLRSDGGTSVSERMHRLTAERIFMSHDDLNINFPNNADLPSEQIFETSGNNLVQRRVQGEFTWAFTVVPMLYEHVAGGGDWHVAGDLYIVSVVVFHSRDPTREWISGPLEAYGGIGGGRVQVTGTEEQLDALREGEWVLLSAANGSGNSAPGVNFHRWYRIRNVGRDYEIVDGNTTASLDVEGPDWPDLDGTSDGVANSGFRVSVFDKAIAVYERTMRASGNSMWTMD